MTVYLALTEYRFEPRWDEHGMPNVETFIEGVTTTEELAKACALWCSGEPLRWWPIKWGWLAAHRAKEGVHFHRVQDWNVLSATDDHGWPTRGAV